MQTLEVSDEVSDEVSEFDQLIEDHKIEIASLMCSHVESMCVGHHESVSFFADRNVMV